MRLRRTQREAPRGKRVASEETINYQRSCVAASVSTTPQGCGILDLQSAESFENEVCIGEIWKEGVRVARQEFFVRVKATGTQSDCARAEAVVPAASAVWYTANRVV